jgi:hypothetical protein
VCLPEQVLFLRAVFAHWIAALGVLLTLTPLISDKWRRRIEEKVPILRALEASDFHSDLLEDRNQLILFNF